MEEFNAYTASTRYFFPKEPDTQKHVQQEEIDKILAQLPLLKEVVERLDERIAFYDSLDSIQVDVDADPLTFQKVHAANKLTKQSLSAERKYILGKVELLKKKQR